MWRRRQAAAGVREMVDLTHERRESVRIDRPFRLAVAWDEAFSFCYQANLDLLAQRGMDLVYFSSMRDRALPDDGTPSALWLCAGGGQDGTLLSGARIPSRRGGAA